MLILGTRKFGFKFDVKYYLPVTEGVVEESEAPSTGPGEVSGEPTGESAGPLLASINHSSQIYPYTYLSKHASK